MCVRLCVRVCSIIRICVLCIRQRSPCITMCMSTCLILIEHIIIGNFICIIIEWRFKDCWQGRYGRYYRSKSNQRDPIYSYVFVIQRTLLNRCPMRVDQPSISCVLWCLMVVVNCLMGSFTFRPFILCLQNWCVRIIL